MPNSPRDAPQGARIPRRILLGWGGGKIPRGFCVGVPKAGEAKFHMTPGYYKLMNKWTWLKSPVWLLWLKVHLGSVLESAFQQKQKCSTLRVCIESEVKQWVLYFSQLT